MAEIKVCRHPFKPAAIATVTYDANCTHVYRSFEFVKNNDFRRIKFLQMAPNSPIDFDEDFNHFFVKLAPKVAMLLHWTILKCSFYAMAVIKVCCQSISDM